MQDLRSWVEVSPSSRSVVTVLVEDLALCLRCSLEHLAGDAFSDAWAEESLCVVPAVEVEVRRLRSPFSLSASYEIKEEFSENLWGAANPFVVSGIVANDESRFMFPV